MVTIDRARFAENLVRERQGCGYTTYTLARALGLGLTHVRRWEQGVRLPSLNSLVALCAVLDCHPDDLLEGSVMVQRWEPTEDNGGAA